MVPAGGRGTFMPYSAPFGVNLEYGMLMIFDAKYCIPNDISYCLVLLEVSIFY